MAFNANAITLQQNFHLNLSLNLSTIDFFTNQMEVVIDGSYLQRDSTLR